MDLHVSGWESSPLFSTEDKTEGEQSSAVGDLAKLSVGEGDYDSDRRAAK